MTDLFAEPADATLLTAGERAGLKPSWIATRADLNIAEQDNIDKAVAWAFRNRRATLLTIPFALQLHRRMFGDVWSWAGAYRGTERNIGIAPHLIADQTATLLDNARHWIDTAVYTPDEIAVRLHHRLVFIHPFANGNGRHARLLADLLIRRLGGSPFTWGAGNIANIGVVRRAYIDALRAADDHRYDQLLAFARA